MGTARALPSLGEYPTFRRDPGVTSRESRRDRILSTALTVYAAMWILEGAARKWLPGADSIFYIARDGLLIAGLAYAAVVVPTVRRRVVGVFFWSALLALALVGLCQVIVFEIPLQVVLIGYRNICAPLIPIYLVWRYRPRDVWRRVAIVVLALVPLEAALAVLQAGSPATSLVNRELGDGGASFTTAFGVVRASGTFTSPFGFSLYSGLALLLSLVALTRRFAPRGLVYVALISSVVLLAVGGSRSSLLYAGIATVGLIVALAATANFAAIRSLLAIAAVVVITASAAALFFPTIVNAFMVRIQTAGDSDSIDERLLGSAFGFLEFPAQLLGHGLGTHGNVGLRLGSDGFWIEDENTRLVAELGIVGFAFLAVRLSTAAVLLVWVVTNLRSLPLATSAASPLLAYFLVVGGTTTQPSSHGFFALLVIIVIGSYYDSRLADTATKPRNGARGAASFPLDHYVRDSP